MPVSEVDAVFYYVRTDSVVRPPDLPGRAGPRATACRRWRGDYSGSVINWAMASDLDRVDHHRSSADWVAGLWRAEDAKLLKLDANARFTTNTGGSKLRMTRPFVEFDSQRHRLLGLLNGSPIFAVETLTEGEVHDLREVGFQLSDNERDIAAAAAALVTLAPAGADVPAVRRPDQGDQRRLRPALRRSARRDHFPRTDPAVIVAVVDEADRLLLGGQPTWGNRVSVLAGFVEAGESLEQAIHREIGEEVDIDLGELTYFGSQPWPFPRSLMVGFFARAREHRICVDANEIAHADWYTRDGLQAKLASGELGLPGPSSIASRLIQTWLDGPTPLAPDLSSSRTLRAPERASSSLAEAPPMLERTRRKPVALTEPQHDAAPVETTARVISAGSPSCRRADRGMDPCLSAAAACRPAREDVPVTATMEKTEETADAEKHPVDQVPPLGPAGPLGLQHVLAMYAGAVAVPLIVGGALIGQGKLQSSDLPYLISADLLVAGIATLIQSLGFWRFGVRLPLMQGCTFAAVAPMIAIGSQYGITAIYGSVIACGVFMMLLAPVFAKLLRFFPPLVTGTVILIIGLSLMAVAAGWAGGGAASRRLRRADQPGVRPAHAVGHPGHRAVRAAGAPAAVDPAGPDHRHRGRDPVRPHRLQRSRRAGLVRRSARRSTSGSRPSR